MAFVMDEVSCLRTLDHDQIDIMLAQRREWREIAQHRLSNHGQILTGTPPPILHKDITDHTVRDLHALAELLLTTRSDYKLVVSINQAHVYTNDLTLIDLLDQLLGISHREYSQSQINRPANTIRLKNPKHKFRSYFKTTKLSAQQKLNLDNFLINQRQSSRPSPSLTTWIKGPWLRTQDYFFVDYNSESWLTMLALTCPGLIRKTNEIISG
jgi:hypothetical protein